MYSCCHKQYPIAGIGKVMEGKPEHPAPNRLISEKVPNIRLPQKELIKIGRNHFAFLQIKKQMLGSGNSAIQAIYRFS